MSRPPKVALVYDWLTNMGGAEKLLLALHEAYPTAPIYTSVFDPAACPDFAKLDVRTTWLQKLPTKLRFRHQFFPVLRARAFRSLDLRDYDIIISSASAEAKAVRKRPDALHICYCHTPTRYYWSHYKEYLAEPGFGWLNPFVRLLIPPFVRRMRALDLQSVKGVDYFLANSNVVAARIKKYYHRDATVIHPPVDVRRFAKVNVNNPRHGFVVVGRQVPYKRIDLAIQACNKLDLPLTVYGDGPEHEHLRRIAGPAVKFVTGASDARIVTAFASAEAFIMPQLEDFGIVQIEAMASGTPVIAFGEGGALDAVRDGTTGILFKEQTVDSLCAALNHFSQLTFNHHTIQKHAQTFSKERFIQQIQQFVAKKSSN